MKKLLSKELKLTASIISFLFIGFGLITLVPGYPILVGSFFCCLGIFQTFQAAREANDITYTALLPVAKSDVVKAKYIFCIFIEACYFVIAGAVTLVRMTALADSAVYRSNPLMNANLCYLGFVLVIFGLFNAIFVRGFFKTAYKFSKPFVSFIIVAFLVIGIAETMVHVPMLRAMNAFGFEHMGLQLGVFLAGLAIAAIITVASMRRAITSFEKIDL